MQSFSEIIILLENVFLSEKYGSKVRQVLGLLTKNDPFWALLNISCKSFFVFCTVRSFPQFDFIKMAS